MKLPKPKKRDEYKVGDSVFFLYKGSVFKVLIIEEICLYQYKIKGRFHDTKSYCFDIWGFDELDLLMAELVDIKESAEVSIGKIQRLIDEGDQV